MYYLIIEKNMYDDDFIQELKSRIIDLKLVTKYNVKEGGWDSTLDKLLSFWKNYLLLSIDAIKSSKKNDCIITWQVFVGVITGVILKSFAIKRKLIVLSFIYRPRKNRLINFIRFKLTRFGLSTATYVICYSSFEACNYTKLFGLPNTNFVFVQLGKSYELLKGNVQNNEYDYIFSAGQSNRDYNTLINAMKRVNTNLLIATTNKLRVPKDLSEKIEIKQLHGDELQEKIFNSILVVIPLEELTYSSGQIVLINAMALGKCVIMTESKWSKNYIQHTETGWLIPPNNEKLLSESINLLLNNEKKRKYLEDNARQYYVDYLSGKMFGERLSQIIKTMNYLS